VQVLIGELGLATSRLGQAVSKWAVLKCSVTGRLAESEGTEDLGLEHRLACGLLPGDGAFDAAFSGCEGYSGHDGSWWESMPWEVLLHCGGWVWDDGWQYHHRRALPTVLAMPSSQVQITLPTDQTAPQPPAAITTAVGHDGFARSTRIMT
jgi:hypothetical protein